MYLYTRRLLLTSEAGADWATRICEAGTKVGGVDDGLLQVVSGEPEPGADNQYVTGVAAVCAGGNIERAMTAGVELAEAATKVTGRPTMFVRSVTGPYGGVGWLTGHGTIADVEAGQDAMAADPGWLKLVDSTGGAFVEDASITVSTLYRKIA